MPQFFAQKRDCPTFVVRQPHVFVSVTSIVTIISILSIAVGQRGQAQTPGQGQDSGRNANA